MYIILHGFSSWVLLFTWLLFYIKKITWLRPTLPGGCPPSTISAQELNFCVRNGNRCILFAIITKFIFLFFKYEYYINIFKIICQMFFYSFFNFLFKKIDLSSNDSFLLHHFSGAINNIHYI